MGKSLLPLLQITTVFFVVTTPLYYGVSSLASRLVLLAAFGFFSASMILATNMDRCRIGMGMTLLGSLLFLLWRSSFAGELYVERAMNYRQYIFASQYAQVGHLVFTEPHSYFFAPSYILYILLGICDIPPVITVYVSLLLYGVFAALVAVMIGRTICRTGSCHEERNAQALLGAVVAICVVSFAFSERSLDGGGLSAGIFSLVMVLLVLFFARGLKSRSHAMAMLILATGVALGSTDGTLLLVPIFIFLSLTSKNKAVLVYGVVPLAYFVFAGYTYVSRLRAYSTYALDGLWQFFGKIVRGEPWESVIPWERASLLSREDAFAGSVFYLSLMILSIVVAAMATYALMKESGVATDKGISRAYLLSVTACLWLWFVVGSIAYVGTSIKPEVSFSDIRTIGIVIMSWCLPFVFISRKFLAMVTRKRILLVLIVAMMLVACLRTPYQVYPKSSHDSVNALEDARLGQTSIYAAGRHLTDHYELVLIVGDYNMLYRSFASQFRTSQLNETVLSGLQVGGILIYSKAGINYPSPWQSPESYVAAFDFAKEHNRTYDNGAVVIAWSAI
jgi:hypothetical protein